MSEPLASVVVPEASAAPEPPEDPPTAYAGFHGLRVTPQIRDCVKPAHENSVLLDRNGNEIGVLTGNQRRIYLNSDQIAPVNRAYWPTSAELAAAERIVTAFREAEARGVAALEVDGQMVDYPVAQRAQAMLDAARRINPR